ncbi:MAG: M55 family metallopeptidase [Bacilli bacterium]|nr:M55 family metallopeptidase [Bacilli bacterium]
MKVFISADIEGVNGITHWNETEATLPLYYNQFQHQMNMEVKAACLGAKDAKAETIFVKDAHDTARNLLAYELPDDIILHRGWNGGICSMMAGLDETYDAVVFVGYHSPSKASGNVLAHTMNTKISHIKINGEIASEFLINAYYAAYKKVPVAFLSGDKALTEYVKQVNPNIEIVATKDTDHGATFSLHPNITNKQIQETIKKSLTKDLSKNIVSLPSSFTIEVEYRTHAEAYSKSFFPKAKLIDSNKIQFKTKDYYDALVFMKFVL